ncbi:hypothetical protein HFP51_11700 [Parasphingopyxis sp. CP4]|uniref:hypothetical protein n=1 Tax=Parasphingopyxis sp. CP4 TaxID=2724527 RepID=UPI0015A4E182|nr:hypothetical protein [Parasphingopyxis sp. CP4]QLC22785.1 hypothetical protein HFP51_11700 [Parasphingopyxis sp. CP4]
MTIRPFLVIAPIALTLAACGGGEAGESVDADSDAQSAESIPMPDWLPEDFPVPDDFIAESDRQFGASTYMLRGRTATPLEGLYEQYAEDLTVQGFEVRQTPELVEQDLVFFNGNGWEDSTVRIIDSGDHRTLEIGLSRVPS